MACCTPSGSKETGSGDLPVTDTAAAAAPLAAGPTVTAQLKTYEPASRLLGVSLWDQFPKLR
jgi:hypothetical protein